MLIRQCLHGGFVLYCVAV